MVPPPIFHLLILNAFRKYAILGSLLIGAMGIAFADDDPDPKGNNGRAGLPSYTGLKNALAQAVTAETSV
jgi:hypothetical protein